MAPPHYVQARVPPKVEKALKRLAERENTTLARLTGRLLAEAMERILDAADRDEAESGTT